MGLRLHRDKAFHSVALLAGLFVIIIGVIVLIGWAFNVAALKGPFSALATMKATTPLEIILWGGTFVHERCGE